MLHTPETLPLRRRRRVRKRYLLLGSTLLILLAIWYWFVRPATTWLSAQHITPSIIRSLIFATTDPLEMTDNRVNVAFLGTAGGDHDGADLTDTIVFASLHATQDDGVLLSLPRDIWLPSLKQKINTAYAIGESKQKGGGLILAKAAIEEVTGQRVGYAWRIDFAGFTKMIDQIGGVNITVPEEITDNKYPIPGKENDLCSGDPAFSCRYEQLHFDPGPQTMNGARALKYVRSRQAQGDEGTDFSRAKRQQQVLLAFKDKVTHQHYWQQPQKAKELFATFIQATETDMPVGESLVFLRRFLAISNDHIRHIVLDDGDEQTNRPGFLINPPVAQYDGLWVLAPRTGSFAEIQRYVTCQLTKPACAMHP